MADSSPGYVLGHTRGELARLASQARRVDPITEQFLIEAGVGAGMRVLDVGTGAGHVAFLAAALVSENGEVVGVDRSAAAVAAASSEAGRRGLTNVSFVQGDPAELSYGRPFDVVTGRYVLQFQRDPAGLLRALVGLVRPGGIAVFHELDWGGVWSYPPVPSYDACCAWCMETIDRSGAETHMGLKLYGTFAAAGMRETSMRLEAAIGGAAQNPEAIEQVVALSATLAPAMQRLGVATAEDLAIETLRDRIVRDAMSLNSVLVGRLQVGCWSRV